MPKKTKLEPRKSMQIMMASMMHVYN